MNKYEAFVNYIEELRINSTIPAPDGFEEVLHVLKNQSLSEKAKPILTEAGVELLEYLQSQGDVTLKASDIALGMNVSSRKITGAIRKLAEDKFVNKFGQNPVNYSLTERGKNFDIQEYKKKLSEKNTD